MGRRHNQYKLIGEPRLGFYIVSSKMSSHKTEIYVIP